MRIFITGFILLVIWSFFSMWLYVDILKPATKPPVVVQPVPETQNREADSLAKFYASMPQDLMIFFNFDKAIPTGISDMEGKITEFKAWLDKYPSSMITVTGHSDFIGTPEYNEELGRKRAEIVMKFLQEKGIPAERMEISSMGEDEPVGSPITSEGRAKNRRTVVSIKK